VAAPLTVGAVTHSPKRAISGVICPVQTFNLHASCGADRSMQQCRELRSRTRRTPGSSTSKCVDVCPMNSASHGDHDATSFHRIPGVPGAGTVPGGTEERGPADGIGPRSPRASCGRIGG
jgi:hypothetical protein